MVVLNKQNNEQSKTKTMNGCEEKILNPDRIYPVRNLTDDTELTDTLCLKAEQSHCTYKRCTGSIYMPTIPNQRPVGILRPIEETKKQATEFFEEYYDSLKRVNSDSHKHRLDKVIKDIDEKGTYHLDYDELCFGAKQAWRNAERCIGRIQYKKLHVFDGRNIKTAFDMYQILIKHMEYATNGGNLRSTITVFPPRTENNKDCRLWNAQLVRYAGYKEADGTITGDPASVELTEICQKLGWVGKGSQFDILPWILQAHGEQPEIYAVPEELCLEVDIKHPTFPKMDELKLKWYALPAVANMAFDCGGIEFPAAPFNGWYMATELGARNFTDTHRYNLMKPIAKLMDFDTSNLQTLWKDKVCVELTFAVLDSFKKAGVTIGDHHTTSESFMKHHRDEIKVRGGCPADWVWIVPPISGATCPVFHQEMVKYHLRPSYEYQSDAWKTFTLKCDEVEAKPHRKAHLKSVATVARLSASLMLAALRKRNKVTVLYATETGKSETFARTLNKICSSTFDSKVLCMDEYNFEDIYTEECMLFVTSTFGNGEAPDNGKVFGKKLQNLTQGNIDSIPNLRYGVFGLGSRAYPKFCEYGHLIDNALKALGSDQIIECGEGDELCGQEDSFEEWAKHCYNAACQKFHIKKQENISVISKTIKTGAVEWVDGKYRYTKTNNNVEELCTALSKLHKKKIFDNKTISVVNLQDKKSGRATDLVKVKIDDSPDLTYTPGDHLCIYPSNNATMVRNLLDRVEFDVKSNDVVNVEVMGKEDDKTTWNTIEKLPMPATLDRIFTSYLDITSSPSTKLLKLFADNCKDKEEKDKILELVDNSDLYEDWKFKNFPNVYETLCSFQSVKIEAGLLISHLPTLKTRYYSISSSQDVYSDEVHATVSLVEYKTHDGQKHQGVCSSYLHSLKPGQSIPSHVRRVTTFSLPEDKSVPVIMIGPGTGVAPFRAFWQQRAFDMKNSPNENFGEMILFFGCRDSQQDDIFAEETTQMIDEGGLTKVYTAYSRDKNHPRRYVQYLMKLNYVEICDLIAIKNAQIYVCGDVTMAADVNKTLIDMFEIYMASSYDHAKEFVDEIKEEDRYHEDIYGVTLKTEQTTERVRQGARRARRVTSLIKMYQKH